jgi:hypothetical protein
MTDVDLIANVEAIGVDPGDVIVVEARRLLKVEQAQALQEQVRLAFPGHEVVILSPYLKLYTRRAHENLKPEEYASLPIEVVFTDDEVAKA